MGDRCWLKGRRGKVRAAPDLNCGVLGRRKCIRKEADQGEVQVRGPSVLCQSGGDTRSSPKSDDDDSCLKGNNFKWCNLYGPTVSQSAGSSQFGPLPEGRSVMSMRMQGRKRKRMPRRGRSKGRSHEDARLKMSTIIHARKQRLEHQTLNC